jgi:hypothetical protein
MDFDLKDAKKRRAKRSQLSVHRERQRRYERGNRATERERKRTWRARMATVKSAAHGKTRVEIHEILVQQGTCCAVCKSTQHHGHGWHGDHDHKTGAFRGVLCRGCNVGLGHFKDNVQLLRAAIHYIEEHANHRAQLKALL